MVLVTRRRSRTHSPLFLQLSSFALHLPSRGGGGAAASPGSSAHPSVTAASSRHLSKRCWRVPESGALPSCTHPAHQLHNLDINERRELTVAIGLLCVFASTTCLPRKVWRWRPASQNKTQPSKTGKLFLQVNVNT